MGGSAVDSPPAGSRGMIFAPWAFLALLVMPGPVICSYFSFAVVFAIGLAAVSAGGEWQKSRGFDKLILFGPIFYAAPIAGFGTEHFTITRDIASLIPPWIPWHYFWAYLVGGCFIAAALSLATGIARRLSAGLLALTFFLFVVLMDAPGWLHHPHNRFALALALRELSFSGGPLALAASLSRESSPRAARLMARTARYFMAVPVLYYSLEQFLHADHVPGIPLELLMPGWLPGHAFWTYLAAAVYAVGGALLLAGRNTRAAAAWLGLTVLFLVLVVYVPVAVAKRATLEGINYMADTLMYGGALLMLARAMPRES